MKTLHWSTISKRALNPVPYWNESFEDWNRTQRWRPLENTELSKFCPQNVFIKSLDELWPSRISRLVPSLQIYANKRDVVLNLTKFPSSTVIIQVHFILRGNVSGYRGEKSLPVSPLKRMTLSIPCFLQGPMVAEIENKKTHLLDEYKTSTYHPNFYRLRVVALSLSPSCETRKKPARKKMTARDPGGEMHAKRGTTA